MRDAEPVATQRHDLLTLRVDAWHRIVMGSTELSSIPEVLQWVGKGYPVMRRRQAVASGGDSAAIQLPRSAGRRRIAFDIPQAAVLSTCRPTLLAAAAEVAPAAWQDTVQDLLAVGRLHGIEPRVFGSLMWQSVTGLDYVHETSDLDLLWPVGDGIGLAALLTDIARIAARRVPPIDGEILFETGQAVQWLELHVAIDRDQDKVLAKSLDGVRLLQVADLHRSQRAA